MEQETKIVFADDLLPAVASGDKVVTIRKGFRHYAVGQKLDVFAASGPQQKYRVIPVRVTWCRAKDIPEMLVYEDGFAGYEDMYMGMRNYYPGFNEESGVTVLEFVLA